MVWHDIENEPTSHLTRAAVHILSVFQCHFVKSILEAETQIVKYKNIVIAFLVFFKNNVNFYLKFQMLKKKPHIRTKIMFSFFPFFSGSAKRTWIIPIALEKLK